MFCVACARCFRLAVPSTIAPPPQPETHKHPTNPISAAWGLPACTQTHAQWHVPCAMCHELHDGPPVIFWIGLCVACQWAATVHLVWLPGIIACAQTQQSALDSRGCIGLDRVPSVWLGLQGIPFLTGHLNDLAGLQGLSALRLC